MSTLFEKKSKWIVTVQVSVEEHDLSLAGSVLGAAVHSRVLATGEAGEYIDSMELAAVAEGAVHEIVSAHPVPEGSADL